MESGLFCKFHNLEVQGVCFKTPCDKKSRLVCFECCLIDHSDHTNFILELDNIYNFSLTNCQKIWPIDEKGQLIKNSIQSIALIENEQNLKKSFQDIFNKIEGQLQEQRKMIISQFNQQKDIRQAKIEELIAIYSQRYSLQKLQVKIVNLFFFLTLIEKMNSNQISDQDAKAEIKQFIESLDSEESKTHLKQIQSILEQDEIKQLVQFDKKRFEADVGELLDVINQLKKSFSYLNVNFGQEFLLEKSSKFPLEQINEIEVGRKFKLTGKAVLLSSKVLFGGEYTVEIMINQIVKGDCVVMGLVKESEIASTNFWSDACSALCIACPHLDAHHFTKIQGNYFGELIGQQVFNIKVKINIQKDIFSISDDKDQNIFQTNLSLKNSKWRFYIYKYKDSPDSFEFSLGEVRFISQN